MRTAVTLSLPAKVALSVKKRAKKEKMTLSAYMLRLVLDEEKMITEDELLERCREAEENYRNGNCIVLKSAEDIEKFFQARSSR